MTTIIVATNSSEKSGGFQTEVGHFDENYSFVKIFLIVTITIFLRKIMMVKTAGYSVVDTVVGTTKNNVRSTIYSLEFSLLYEK